MKGRKPGRRADLTNWVFNEATDNLIRHREILYNPKTQMYSPGPNMKRSKKTNLAFDRTTSKGGKK